jgi:hypothetical protein
MQKLSVMVVAVAWCGLLCACTTRDPILLSSAHIEETLKPEEIVLTGPTQGSESVGCIFGITVSPNSFLEAEQAALKANNSDVLVERVRYIGTEGLAIGSFVLFGNKVYYVEGTGAKIVQK